MAENEKLQIIRHSCAHVMAEAVKHIFPGTKIAIGPAIENGFYYDFDFPTDHKITEDDFAAVEKEMRKIISSGAEFVRKEISKDEALKIFADEPYKVEIINDLPQDATISTYEQDGYTMGYLDNFKIDSSGIITGVYSNGTNRTIGQVALASFANQNGLEKAGNNTYTESNNSGIAKIGESGVAGNGNLLAGALEMSNVDLTEQFTDMITTQRGFQSNAKTIQTSDTMLETVLSLKR